MPEHVDVVVVGAGVGGLATAIRLAASGRRVVVAERLDVAGGKLATERRDGYTFDVGPSLLTLPSVLDDLFSVAGTSLDEHVDLVRLDPQFHYRWPDGATLVVRDDPDATAAAFEHFTVGGGAAWRRFDERGRRIWDVSQRTFLAGPMANPLQLLRRMRSPADLRAIEPLTTLHRHAARYFADPRLVQWAGRYATYSGSSPYHAPATLTCIPHIESRFGCWYPRGGLDTLRAALFRVATAVGAEVRLGADVARITATAREVSGVELVDGTRLSAPVVVANADAEHVYGSLLPNDGALRRVRRAGRSFSGFVVIAAVRGSTPGIGHHNVWFSADDGAEFAALGSGRMADGPTISACVSSVTDASQAPVGNENWVLLVNAPPDIELDADDQRGVLLDRLAASGVDLRPRLEWSATLTPRDLARRYRAPGARSTGRPRTVGGRRSSGPVIVAGHQACTSSGARAILAADSRWSRSAPASSPTSSPPTPPRADDEAGADVLDRPACRRRHARRAASRQGGPPSAAGAGVEEGPPRRHHRRRPGPRRGDAHRAAAGRRRRRAGRRRGHRRRRRVDRLHGGGRRRRGGDGRRRASAAAGMGGQGLGAAAGHRRGERRVDRGVRCRRPPELVAAASARRSRRGRRARPPHRRRSLRLPDRAPALAAPGAC